MIRLYGEDYDWKKAEIDLVVLYKSGGGSVMEGDYVLFLIEIAFVGVSVVYFPDSEVFLLIEIGNV
jgi:hypothetical protein